MFLGGNLSFQVKFVRTHRPYKPNKLPVNGTVNSLYRDRNPYQPYLEVQVEGKCKHHW